MRPLLSYYGGKQTMTKHLVPLVPTKLERYVEPFAGGASLFFALPEKPAFTILNDTRDELINYYRIVQTRPEELKGLIDATLHSESDWRRAKRVSCDLNADPLERAWGTHIKIFQSFARKGDTWARHARKREHRSHELGSEPASRLSKHVEISCEDGLKCIRRTDKENAFFYVDPPYPGSGRQDEWSAYGQQDWERLIETLNGIKGSYLLSGYANAVTPEGCETFTFTRSLSASGGTGKQVTEYGWRRLNPYHAEQMHSQLPLQDRREGP